LSPSIIALTITSIIVLIGSLLGFLARFHHKMDLEQWTVAGRGFGLVLVWLLMAGEIYTTFTFLGASGWAYSRGGPVLYVIGYAPLMYVVSFYILPPVWEVGRKHGLQTQADFFQVRYGSKYLAAFVALVGVVFLIPYLQIQVTGLATVLFIGIAIPRIYFGGVGKMFAALASAKPDHLVMPGSTTNLGHLWYVSSVFMTAVGFYMWPQYFAATFTAKSAKIIQRNAIIMPLYSITMSLVLFVGFCAVLVLPHLSNGDLALLTLVGKTFPAWFLGIIGGAGALTAMLPAAIQLLAGATLYAKNLFRPIFAPRMTDQQVAGLARIMVFVLTLGALFFAIFTSVSLVSLLMLGYAGVAQLFPGVILGLFSKRVTTAGVFAGLIIGISIAALLMLTGHDPYYGLNAGFIALGINFTVTALVSAVTPVRVGGFEQPSLAMSASTASSSNRV
jgi:SSS family solute:Na+ symporter